MNRLPVSSSFSPPLLPILMVGLAFLFVRGWHGVKPGVLGVVSVPPWLEPERQQASRREANQPNHPAGMPVEDLPGFFKICQGPSASCRICQDLVVGSVRIFSTAVWHEAPIFQSAHRRIDDLTSDARHASQQYFRR